MFLAHIQKLSGKKYIVLFVDWYSCWPEAFPVPDRSAETNLLVA